MGSVARKHRRWLPVSEQRQLCIACRRPILFGERCEGCKRELRQRQRRKPR
jgi:hypothetical protein